MSLSRRLLSDPHAAAALALVQKALDWYVAEAANAEAPPISRDDARALQAAFAGAGAWRPELFDRLITFGQAMWKLTQLGHGPGSNVADALTSLSTIDITPGGPAWQFDRAVDAAAFAKFEFRETSLGIEKAQREHREGWWAHAQKSRAFIMDTVATLPRRRLAVVLGAGSPFDLPLADLARSFERVRLVDIDEAALLATSRGIWKSDAERANVELATVDLTGVNGVLLQRVEAVLAGPASTPDEMEAAVSALVRSYRLPAPPRWAPDDDDADLIVSSCVVSQLAWPWRTYAEGLFERRFGKMTPALEQRWSTAWTELGLRVQQDHINALADAAPLAVLTSDVISHRTALDRSGTERDTGRRVLTMGTESLLERIPSFYRQQRHARWAWSRYRASKRGTEGSRMDVEALVLSAGVEAPLGRTAGGLWLPGS